MVGRCWDVVDDVSSGPMKIIRKEMVNSRPMTLGPVNSREVLCVRIAVTEDVVPVVGDIVREERVQLRWRSTLVE